MDAHGSEEEAPAVIPGGAVHQIRQADLQSKRNEPLHAGHVKEVGRKRPQLRDRLQGGRPGGFVQPGEGAFQLAAVDHGNGGEVGNAGQSADEQRFNAAVTHAVHQGVFLFQLAAQKILHGDQPPEFLKNRSRRAAVQGGQPQVARQFLPKDGAHGQVEHLL